MYRAGRGTDRRTCMEGAVRSGLASSSCHRRRVLHQPPLRRGTVMEYQGDQKHLDAVSGVFLLFLVWKA